MLSQPVSSSFSSARTLQADSTSPSFEGEVLQVSEDEAKQACALARSVLAKVQLPSPAKDLEVYQYPSQTQVSRFLTNLWSGIKCYNTSLTKSMPTAHQGSVPHHAKEVHNDSQRLPKAQTPTNA